MTLRELSDLSGLTYDVLKHRLIKHEWSIEEAVETPLVTTEERIRRAAEGRRAQAARARA
jgi:hypothetical protein